MQEKGQEGGVEGHAPWKQSKAFTRRLSLKKLACAPTLQAQASQFADRMVHRQC